MAQKPPVSQSDSNHPQALLSEEQKTEILRCVSIGCSWRMAAHSARCRLDALVEYAQHDDQFAKMLSEAEDSFATRALANIRKAAADPRYRAAKAWLLKRGLPLEPAPLSPPKIRDNRKNRKTVRQNEAATQRRGRFSP